MKKTIIIICIIVFFLFNVFKNSNNEEQIRIRIIANSDSKYDQNIKKELVKYLYENFNLNFENIDECDSYIKENIEGIKSKLTSKFDNVKVSYVNHKFYNKSYNNIVSNNEQYKTLLIEINEAKGENFWGVLYSKNHIECEETIKYNSYILELFRKG